VADADIKLNSAGMREMLKMPGIVADVRRRAEAVARAAGDGFEARTTPRRNRARAEAVASSFDARRRQSKSSTLLAALSAARR